MQTKSLTLRKIKIELYFGDLINPTPCSEKKEEGRKL
jgi:hypothetical protein